MEKLDLSARAFDRITKAAMTIVDLDHYDKDIGLGLAYVKTFLDIHDASIEITSNEKETVITLIFDIP